MIKLFISPEHVKATTSISSATDNDLIKQKIYYAQISDVTRILGQNLYDKILTDIDNLQGFYKTIFEKYIIDIHVFYTAYYFVLFNEVKLSNIGNTILSLDRGQPATNTNALADQYKNLGINIENNFRKFMETSDIPEWNFTKKNTETTNFNDFY